MTENKKKSKKKKKISILKFILIVLLMVTFIIVGSVGGLVFAVIKNTPKIDPTKIDSMLSENSVILDKNGNLIEKIETQEYRTIIEDLDEIPDYLENAFIAIEDTRFRKHIGIDFKRIIGALIEDIKAGKLVQGGSTITQQLARNIYLNREKKITRKIKEAYIAIQIERHLTKDQILKLYLNTVDLGKGAFGIQEAAQTYFSKNVNELTIAESALLAGIPKSPTIYSPYILLKSENVDKDKYYIIGEYDIYGTKYTAVFNNKALERQRLVLKLMREQNYITEEEYQKALNEDIKKAIKPGQKKIKGISSYFTDYVKEQVLDTLVNKLGYTKEEAKRELYTGGLKIYSTMDINMQHKVEKIYDNFVNVILGNTSKTSGPVLISWSKDKYGNVLDSYKKIILYKKENLLDSNYNLIIENGTYNFSNGDLLIKNKKLNIYPKTIDIIDYYTIDNNKNLVTHTVGSLNISKDNYYIDKSKRLVIKSNFLNKNKDFYKVDGNKNLLINPKYFYINKTGVVQPQSAVVIMDYRTGEIKALVGGRNVKGNKVLNRAVHSQRQPGSAIKPIAVYLPALDNGYTAATVIDDIPHYDSKGRLWPKNWNRKFLGLTTLREAVEQSMNVIAVKVLEDIGIDTSIEYLTRLGIINENDPSKDNFVSRSENRRVNDENLAALALGGLSKGFTPLDMTKAYAAIANQGIYIEPITFTKIVDRDGNVLYENKTLKNRVVTPQVAYLMTDILKGVVTRGTGWRAQLYQYNTTIPVAGKTGTTQNKADAWFIGYTPYYIGGVWIGNDNPGIKLSQGSKLASILWKNIMKEIHTGFKPKNFVKPQGLVVREICTESGKLATDLCKRDPRGSTVRSEIFIKGTEPTEFCDVHVEALIDTSTNKLANKFCPPELVEKRVFIKRKTPYIPEENNGYIPADYQYTLPTEVCDVHSQKNNFNDWLNKWFFNNTEQNPDKNKHEDDQENIQPQENNSEDTDNE
ncbi:penicillin-binding protein 1A [Caloranaerobacter azorensis DSM 13643]|uniref:Penicillin-binding protein 1A n=1 Tax=Caloranaerobacter azorensis DSM 13643 TaxID=1121264 RepID=A0A1M5WJV2_9FIRM|nr:PBP1A family penicillin-binding protein [Caloranaerobacter azorensis]SHH87464.1 penicillin-binding protein 1A [Caloranaerobacter azorensis DSM 13643]